MSKILLDSASVAHLTKIDATLGSLILSYGELEYDSHTNPLEQLIDSILGQMLSNKVANEIRSRFKALCNYEVTSSSVLSLDTNKLREIGISKRKAVSIISLASKTNEVELSLLQNYSDQEVFQKLTEYKGIGPWTAKMFLLFYLERENILPYEDLAFRQSFTWLYGVKSINDTALVNYCSKWSPYSSIAARYLYRALDEGYVQKMEPYNLKYWPKYENKGATV